MDNPTNQNAPSVPSGQTAQKSPAVRTLATAAAILLAGGVAFFIWLNWPKLTNEKMVVPAPPSGQTAPTPSATPMVQEQIPETPAATGTALIATSTLELPSAATGTAAETDKHKLGETVRFYQGDAISILNNNGFPTYWISAMEFTDSRCPNGVQCIWAGERGIRLQVTLIGTKALPQQIMLSETTRRSAQVSGLKLTLVEIGDAKGGTYAEIKFE